MIFYCNNILTNRLLIGFKAESFWFAHARTVVRQSARKTLHWKFRPATISTISKFQLESYFVIGCNSWRKSEFLLQWLSGRLLYESIHVRKLKVLKRLLQEFWPTIQTRWLRKSFEPNSSTAICFSNKISIDWNSWWISKQGLCI